MFAIHNIFTIVVIAPVAIAAVAYVIYPAFLLIIAAARKTPPAKTPRTSWPYVTITVPVYNAASSIRATLDHLVELDYPREKLQILAISDASNDGTDEIIRSYAARGVQLLRMPERMGKTVAENAALGLARGTIMVNVDSTILIPAGSLKKLVAVFEDPTIGVASGRDVSLGDLSKQSNRAESGYVGYEMWVRDLETRVGSIVGASGCFYGARRSIHADALPSGLSWDFASALNARIEGYRSVSVPDAICIVPRATEIRTELKRKVRTMARGLRTLFYYRQLMNPFRYGAFAIMLLAHKLLRWLPYLLAPFAYGALCVLSFENNVARMVLGLVSLGILAGIAGIRWKLSPVPKPIALAGFVVAVFTAGFLAWVAASRRAQLATWDPTPRPRLAPDLPRERLEAQIGL